MALTPARLDLLPRPDGGRLEYLVTGSGAPATVFAHGVGASIAETRPLATAVRGTKWFFHFRWHGRSQAPDDRWDYGALADELRFVADRAGARRALGVSMGAGALARLLADTPDRFERAVFFLPAVLDEPRRDVSRARLHDLARRVESADVPGLAQALVDDLPADLREHPGARRYVEERAAALAGTPVAGALRQIPDEVAVADRAVLSAVRARVLVVGQEGDDLHPAAIARELAAAIPGARLHVFDEGWPLWRSPRTLHELIAGFLNQ